MGSTQLKNNKVEPGTRRKTNKDEHTGNNTKNREEQKSTTKLLGAYTDVKENKAAKETII